MHRISRSMFFLLCAMAMVVSAPVWAGNDLVCNLCGKEIIRKYLEAGGSIYHESCFERAPKCAVCGLPVKERKTLHPACESKCLKCGVCSRPITEKYVDSGGKPFHKSCFDRVEKCGYCGGPIKKGQAVKSRGKTYHAACTAELVRCAACGELVSGSFMRLGDECFHEDCFTALKNCGICGSQISPKKLRKKNSGFFHAECLEKSVVCDVCGVYIKGEYLIDSYGRRACSNHESESGCFACHFPKCVEILADGRNICGRCRETSITTNSELWVLFKKVSNYLETYYGVAIEHDITLSMGTVSDLQEKWKGNWKPGLMGQFSRESEFLEYPDGSRKTVRDDFRITVLTHIPRTLLEGVVAHEYFHAWQAENFHEDAALEFKEGTAEAISHQYYLDHDFHAWARGQKANKVDLYRDNLLIALEILGERPVKAFVESIRGLQTFP